MKILNKHDFKFCKIFRAGKILKNIDVLVFEVLCGRGYLELFQASTLVNCATSDFSVSAVIGIMSMDAVQLESCLSGEIRAKPTSLGVVLCCAGLGHAVRCAAYNAKMVASSTTSKSSVVEAV